MLLSRMLRTLLAVIYVIAVFFPLQTSSTTLTLRASTKLHPSQKLLLKIIDDVYAKSSSFWVLPRNSSYNSDQLLRQRQTAPVFVFLNKTTPKEKSLERVWKNSLPVEQTGSARCVSVILAIEALTNKDDILAKTQTLIIVSDLKNRESITSFNYERFLGLNEVVVILEGVGRNLRLLTRSMTCSSGTINASWNEISNLTFKEPFTVDLLFPDSNRGFCGKTLHLATDIDDYPLVFQNTDGKVDGLSVRIIATLSDWLNFTYTTTEMAPDFLFGEYENGSWSGLLELVHSGQKDLTINYFVLALDLIAMEYFDPSIPYHWEGIGFALKMPDPSPAWMNFLKTFHVNVWVAVFLSFMLVPPVLFAIQRRSRSTLTEVYLQSAMSFLHQSVPAVTPSNSSRMAILGWWLTSLLITLYYTSNLIAVLTLPSFPKKLSTIQDLANSQFRLSFVDYGAFFGPGLKSSKKPELSTLAERTDAIILDDENHAALYDKLLQRLKAGTHAITDTHSYLKSLVDRSDSKEYSHYFLKQQALTGPLVFFFRKGSVWRRKINIGIRRLTEAGLLQKWYSDLMEERRDVGMRSHNAPLTLHHLQGPFLLFLVGNAIAVVAFLAEILTTNKPWQKEFIARKHNMYQ